MADFAAALGEPVLVGAIDKDVSRSGDTLWYNAVFLQSPGENYSRAYRKSRPVPGVEGAGWFPATAFGLTSSGYARGRNPRPLPLAGGAVGAMVCYDSAYGETARALVRGGAEWLAVLSNDDWLDPRRPFRTTWAYWQHATHGRLRAIENRMWLVQVAATGYTFAVSPGGHGDTSALDAGEEGTVMLTVGPPWGGHSVHPHRGCAGAVVLSGLRMGGGSDRYLCPRAGIPLVTVPQMPRPLRGMHRLLRSTPALRDQNGQGLIS